jgi:hypothetical protein
VVSLYFADTSALAKRYLVNERGSEWVQMWITPDAGHDIAICETAPVEFFL